MAKWHHGIPISQGDSMAGPESPEDISSRCQELILHLQEPLPSPIWWELWVPSSLCRGAGGPLTNLPSPLQGGGKWGARQQPLPSPEVWPWQLQCLRYSGNKLRSDSTKQLNSAPCSRKNALIEAEPEQNSPAFILLNDTDIHSCTY